MNIDFWVGCVVGILSYAAAQWVSDLMDRVIFKDEK